LAAQVSQFRESDDFKEEGTQDDLEARKRLGSLEERMQQRDHEIAALQTELSQQQHNQEAVLGRVVRLEAEVSALHTAPAPRSSTVPTPKSPPPSIVPSTSVAPAVPSSPLATPPSGSVAQAVVPIVPPPGPIAPASAGLPPPSGWNSAIVADFPKLFEDFKNKQFTLLWRGSRDGFGPNDFHRRCDGHPNTLTVILDTAGNIFGGFTPLEWESRKPKSLIDWSKCWKADPSRKMFLFTLKNPHNVPARRFALMAENKDEAISCHSDYGPRFHDINVSDNCTENTKSYTSNFGNWYTNATGLDGKTFFTGSKYFQVKEIEVFEITD
jgi:hypothetical protein